MAQRSHDDASRTADEVECSPGVEMARDIQPRPTPRRWDAGPRIVCRLTTLHPERHLARAVCNYLADEMPDIQFTLRDDVAVNAVWVCGYEHGNVDVVHEARDTRPEALIVVTGRAPLESWRDEVLAAGADHASGWPIPYSELSRLFHDKGSQAIA